MNGLQFTQSFVFGDQSPVPSDSNSIAHHSDSDCDSTVSDFFASELPGWGPSATVTAEPGSPSTAGAFGAPIPLPHTAESLLTPDNSSSGDSSTVVCTDRAGVPSWSRSASKNRSPKAKSKKKRMPVPTDKKDDKYWERRRKNNMAAKRSRELKRQKTLGDLNQADRAIQENERLKAEIGVHKSEIESLRRLLRDANTTLALWIKARQTTEPLNRLPPSMRNSNGLVHFVDFPQ